MEEPAPYNLQRDSLGGAGCMASGGVVWVRCFNGLFEKWDGMGLIQDNRTR